MFGSSLYTGTAAFKNKWAATYGGTVQEVPELAAQAYDALRVIAKVCVSNGKLRSRKDIFASLNRKGFSLTPAATGTVTFDANGDNIVSQYNVLEMKNGTWKIKV
jgi:ABC-type branched-subunit amino acid transport system substrate-binding protein